MKVQIIIIGKGIIDIKKNVTAIICFLLVAGLQIVSAQVITSVPPTIPNDRFFDEVFSEIVRPALSIRGFDSSTMTGGDDFGLGMKSALPAVLFLISDPHS